MGHYECKGCGHRDCICPKIPAPPVIPEDKLFMLDPKTFEVITVDQHFKKVNPKGSATSLGRLFLLSSADCSPDRAFIERKQIPALEKAIEDGDRELRQKFDDLASLRRRLSALKKA